MSDPGRRLYDTTRALCWLALCVACAQGVSQASTSHSLSACVHDGTQTVRGLPSHTEVAFTVSPLVFGHTPLPVYVSKLWTETVVETDKAAGVAGTASFRWNRLPWSSVCVDSVCRLSPYDTSTVGVMTGAESGTTLTCTTAFAPWTAGAFAVGVAVYLLAPYVAHAVAFHYALGAVLAVVIVLRFLSRRPKSAGIPMLAVLFAANRSSAVLQENFGVWMTWGFSGVLVLAVLAGIIVVYIFKPNENTSLCNVIQWSLQSLALLTITFGSTSEATPVAGATLALLTMTNWLVFAILRMVLRVVVYVLWRLKVLVCGYPRRKLLTREEYEEQKIRFTAESLAQLRTALANDWSSVVGKLSSKKTAHAVHDWAFFGERPTGETVTTNGGGGGGDGPASVSGNAGWSRSGGVVVDDQGRRVDSAEDEMTDEEFERWRVQNELQWEQEAAGEAAVKW